MCLTSTALAAQLAHQRIGIFIRPRLATCPGTGNVELSDTLLPHETHCPPDSLLGCDARRIHYGRDDGGAVVFNLHEAWWCYDGEWKPMSVTEAVYRAGVMSEEAFHREFGSVPPLPDAAFRSGWFSPLV